MGSLRPRLAGARTRSRDRTIIRVCRTHLAPVERATESGSPVVVATLDSLGGAGHDGRDAGRDRLDWARANARPNARGTLYACAERGLSRRLRRDRQPRPA